VTITHHTNYYQQLCISCQSKHPATPHTYPLSLHDALPISRLRTPTSSIWRTRNIASRRSTNGAPSQDSTSSPDPATPSSARCRQRGQRRVTPPPPPPPPPARAAPAPPP